MAKAPLLSTSLDLDKSHTLLPLKIFRTRQVVRMTMALPPHLLRSPNGQFQVKSGQSVR